MAPNPKVFGKYEVIRRLAVGGMGEIFLARQVGVAGFDRLAILKSLLPQIAADGDMLAQFLDEARIVGSVNHPNVVACYEVGQWEGVYFLAMEYINGVDLADLMIAVDDVGLAFPVNVAASVTRAAALGLDSVHHAVDAQGKPMHIVHRDISPHNIMVRADGLAKIVDFGVALATNRKRRTEGGMLKGKLGYIAPEHIRGQTIDGKADQFALGVTLWEMLTGKILYEGEHPPEVFQKVLSMPVPTPSSVRPDVPSALDAIVLRMTAQDPKARYPRLAEAAAALRKFLDARGATEGEASALVTATVGKKLSERLHDLTPVPVQILGISAPQPSEESSAFCAACGAPAVWGDRFCRSCGATLGTSGGGGAPAESTSASGKPQMFHELSGFASAQSDGEFSPPTVPDRADSGENATAVVTVEIVDGAGAHPAPAKTRDAVFTQLEALAKNQGGSTTRRTNVLVASFGGEGRAARTAIAWVRRAIALVPRLGASLSARGAVVATTASTTSPAARARQGDDAEKILSHAKRGTGLATTGARRLARMAIAWSEELRVADETDALVQMPRAPVVVGRDAERAAVDEHIAHASQGRGRQLMFLGEEGSGKSHLLQFAEDAAHDAGFVVGRVGCALLPAAEPYTAARALCRSLAEDVAVLHGASDGRAALERLDLPRRDLQRVLAFLDRAPGADDGTPWDRRGILLRAALHAFVRAAAVAHGVCFIVDDVHLTDPFSSRLIAELAARLSSSRGVLVAAGNPVPGTRILPLAKRMVLAPVPVAAVGDVVAAALGAPWGDSADAVVERVAAFAGGHPGRAVGMARYLRAAHLLHVNGVLRASADCGGFPLPPTTSTLLFARRALGDEQPELDLVTPEQDEAAADAWLRLGAVDAAAAALQAALGRTRAALFGSKQSKDARSAARADAAWHLANRTVDVLQHIDPTRAVEIAQPFLSAPPATLSTTARVMLVRTTAEALVRARRIDEALALVRETLEGIDDSGADVDDDVRGALFATLATALERAGDGVGARQWLQDALPLLRTAPAERRDVLVDALVRLTRFALDARDMPAARELLLPLLEETQKRPIAQVEARALRASLEHHEGAFEKALSTLHEAAAIAARLGDGVLEAQTRLQAARLQAELGRTDDAQREATAAHGRAVDIGWDDGVAAAGALLADLQR